MNNTLFDDTKLNQAVRFVKQQEQKTLDDLVPFRVSILRNITIDHLATFIKYYGYKDGFRPTIRMGEFNGAMQEALDENSFLYKEAMDMVIVCIYPESFNDRLVNAFCSFDETEARKEGLRFVSMMEKIIDCVQKKSNAAIVIHSWPIPTAPAYGILDYQDRDKQLFVFREVNEELRELAANRSGVYILDIDLLQSCIGAIHFLDRRYWHYAVLPYSLEAVRVIAAEHIKFMRALTGKVSKCLVLDCDNTLWGGIIGEDGLTGLALGEAYPGSCYQDLQKAAIDLKQRGVLLALCSKNNSEDVTEVFNSHPGMLLKNEHLVTKRINWKDKATNLKSIAAELNIGVDSLVFVDDNEFEIALVKKVLPMVRTIHLPKGRPELYADLVRRCGFFDSLAFSAEDRRRSEMYKAEVGRKKAVENFDPGSLNEYYRFLKMYIKIRPAEELTIPRCAQLTQRTNQFNLTTKRYSEAEITAFANDENTMVHSLQLSDRFGDLGIIGEIILRKEKDACHIDTFLLSCRVIGRGVEKVLLKHCIQLARQWGCVNLHGMYIPTQKNAQVKDFYPENGFIEDGRDETGVHFLRSLEMDVMHPDYFEEIDAPLTLK